MEEYDELLQAPDESGAIDLSHQAWVTVDETLWAWEDSLKVLNLSFNSIRVISPKLGKLVFLQYLDVSNNVLEELPEAIGQCVRLRVLKADSNRLQMIPPTISNCKLLEELYLSANHLRRLPESIGELKALRILHLQSNRLEQLCPQVAECISLEEIDCTNNIHLVNLPQDILGNSKLILWMCKHNLAHFKVVEELEEANEDLETAAELTEEEQRELREKLRSLQAQNEQLLKERPERYLLLLSHVDQVKSNYCVLQ